MIVELGANDMLRGFDPTVTRAALAAILDALKVRRIAVLLCGVRTQPSLGEQYRSAFATMFSDLANDYNVLFYPTFDDAFVDNAKLKLPDGLHPTADGIEAVVSRILPKVEALIDRAHLKKPMIAAARDAPDIGNRQLRWSIPLCLSPLGGEGHRNPSARPARWKMSATLSPISIFAF